MFCITTVSRDRYSFCTKLQKKRTGGRKKAENLEIEPQEKVVLEKSNSGSIELKMEPSPMENGGAKEQKKTVINLCFSFFMCRKQLF